MSTRNSEELIKRRSELNLTYGQVTSFNSLFIGAISSEVPQSVWDNAIERVSLLFKEDKCQPTKKTEESSQASQP